MSLRMRLILSFTLVVILCLAIAATTVTVVYQSNRDKLALANLTGMARPVYVQVANLASEQKTRREIIGSLQEQALENKVHILLTSNDGKILSQLLPTRNPDVERLDINTEILTPTGCAILTVLGTQSIYGNQGIIEKSGYSCGSKCFKTYVNMLRALLISTQGREKQTIALLESDIDHISGEVFGFTADVLFDAGACDVSFCPIFMKKGRPGYRISVMSPLDKVDILTDLIIKHTRSLGVRQQQIDRIIANREQTSMNSNGKTIREKNCLHKGTSFTKGEYEDLALLARESGHSLLEVMEMYLKRKLR